MDEPHDRNEDEQDQSGRSDLARRLIDMGFAGLASAAALSGSDIAPALLPTLDVLRGWKNREEFLQEVQEYFSLENLHQRVIEDPKAANLWADAVSVAADTDLKRKRVALAKVLRLGLFRDDDAEVDPEPLYLQAIAPLEHPHLAILDLMRHTQTMSDGGRMPVGVPWNKERLIEFQPQLATVLDLVMTQLETWGLMVDDQPTSTRQPSNAQWRVTSFGEKVYEFLEATPDDPDLAP